MAFIAIKNQLPSLYGFIAGIGSLAFGIFVEYVTKELKKNKFWAWIVAIIISGIYIPSIFIILGIIGLLGLVHKNTRTAFFNK